MATTIRELLVKLGVDADSDELSQFDRLLKSTKKSAESGAQSMTALSVAGGEILARGFFAAANAARSFMTSMVDTNVEIQQLQARLNVLTDDGAAAFQTIRDFTATTPFQIQEVTKAYLNLINAGIEPTDAALTSVGNSAASLGVSIADFSEGMQKALINNFERLREMGIAVDATGSKVKFTVAGVTTEVAKNRDAIEGFLIGLGDTRFAGGLEAQAATLGGAISNMKDSFTLFMLAIGDAGFSEALRELIVTLGGIAGESESLAKIIGRTLAAGIRNVTGLIVWMRRNSDTLIRVLRGIGIALAPLITGGASFAAMSKVVGVLSSALNPLVLKLAIIGAVVALVFIAIEDLIGFVQGKDSAIGRALGDGKEADELRATLLEFGAALVGIWDALSAALAGMSIRPVDLLIGALQVVQFILVNLIRGFLGIGTFIGVAAGVAVVALTDLGEFLIDLGDQISAFFTAIWDDPLGTLGVFGTAIMLLFSPLGGLIGMFGAMWVAVTTALDLMIEAFDGFVGWMFDNVLDPLGEGFDAVFGVIGSLFDGAFGLIDDLVDGAKGAASEVANLLGLGETVELDIFASVSDSIGETQANIAAAQSTNVGQVNVNISGSTNMGPEQVERAVAKGTNSGVNRSMRETERATATR